MMTSHRSNQRRRRRWRRPSLFRGFYPGALPQEWVAPVATLASTLILIGVLSLIIGIVGVTAYG